MTSTVYFADIAPLSDAELFEKGYALMSSQRKDRIDRYFFKEDKQLSLGVGLLLRQACLDLGYSHVPDILYEKKPVFKNEKDLHFNLSHSGTKVLCVISDVPCGCDIEGHKKDCLEIAHRFFFEGEYDEIMSKETEEEKQKCFYRMWTLKESFMKATGLGFSLPLNKFSIHIGKEITVKQNVSKKDYSFFTYEIDSEYSCACCLEKKTDVAPDLKEVHFETL